MSEKALYLQVKESLADKIKDDEFAIGSYLPTERELCEEFDVSRITVRRALEELEDEGFVVKERSKGVKVINQSIQYIKSALNQYQGFHAKMRNKGLEPMSFLSEWEVTDLPEKFFNNFSGIEDYYGKQILLLKRLLGVEKKPMIYLRTYLTKETKINVEDYQGGSLYSLIKKKSGRSIAYSREYVIAQISTPKMEKLFRVDHKIPILQRNQIGYTKEGRILFFTEAFYNSEIYQHHFLALKND
jgi:GntR family transcriptional regulator